MRIKLPDTPERAAARRERTRKRAALDRKLRAELRQPAVVRPFCTEGDVAMIFHEAAKLGTKFTL